MCILKDCNSFPKERMLQIMCEILIDPFIGAFGSWHSHAPSKPHTIFKNPIETEQAPCQHIALCSSVRALTQTRREQNDLNVKVYYLHRGKLFTTTKKELFWMDLLQSSAKNVNNSSPVSHFFSPL